MAVYRLIECKKGKNINKIEILCGDDNTNNHDNSKSNVWLSATILDVYMEDNGQIFSREQLLEVIKDNSFYMYDLLVNNQEEVIELTVNRLCENGCLIEQRRFISLDKP